MSVKVLAFLFGLITFTSIAACSRTDKSISTEEVFEKVSKEQVDGALNHSESVAPDENGPKGQDISEEELSKLPFRPFPDSQLRYFRRMNPDGYTLFLDGKGTSASVVDFYLKEVNKLDAAAKVEHTDYGRVHIKSQKLKTRISISEDEKIRKVFVEIHSGWWKL